MKSITKTIICISIANLFAYSCSTEENNDKSTIRFKINEQLWECNDGTAAITNVNGTYTIMLSGKVKDFYENKDSDFLFSMQKESNISIGTYTGTADGGQVSVSYIEGKTYYGTIPSVSPDADFWINIQEIEANSSSPISNKIKGTFGGTLKRNSGMDVYYLPISNGEFYWN